MTAGVGLRLYLRVALLAEGVDRNPHAQHFLAVQLDVALLAEGVDRNLTATRTVDTGTESPSSRRAWIEIEKQYGSSGKCWVALLAEGVDRN